MSLRSSSRYLKKSEWGVVGAFEATLCNAIMKTDILAVIDEAVSHGVRQHRACKLIQIDERRVQRWWEISCKRISGVQGYATHESYYRSWQTIIQEW